ncbi:MAG: 5-guanidino-2-oxopentanoate decarboxylase [Geodermatophilaceae bacterium]|nr:5-guanidino-2-oxopentanoate decarboxylase [Geodermatophilaceae bacterium]
MWHVALMTGGEVLVRSLAAHGIDVVFGIPGNHNLSIYEHLASSNIRHVLSRHEQGCGYAADGYARSSGRPGVALVTAGPAVLNTLAALGQAYSDSIPVLLVSPGMPLRHPYRGNGHLHETKDQHAAVEAVVAASYRVTSVAEIGNAVSQAFADMTAGRPRPVHIEVPIDVLDESAHTQVGCPVDLPVVTAPADQLNRAAAALAEASRPGIVVGGGARSAATEVRLLAERLGATVVTTTNGKGVLPEDHPLSLGAGAHLPAIAEWARTRDVIIAVGTDLGSSDLWNGTWQLDGTLVRIDIDPRQIGVNVRPDIALVSDAARALRSLRQQLGEGGVGLVGGEAAAWASRVGDEASAEGALWRDEIQAIAGVLERDAIVAGDSAAVCYYGMRANLPLHAPGGFLYPTGYGTLGYGLPAAIGAKVAAPERQVVAVLGDGGIMYTLPELASAAAEGLAIPVIVVDNGGYGQIRRNMELRGYAPLGVDLPSPDFAAAGRALGCHGVTIETPEHLSEQLAKALVQDRPTVLHVMEGGAT